jgi:hypothetical protein
MATLINEHEYDALDGQTGLAAGSPLPAQEMKWLEDQTSQTGLSINEQWMFLLNSRGHTSGSLPERQAASWVAEGYTGNWNSLALQFWQGGGVYTP